MHDQTMHYATQYHAHLHTAKSEKLELQTRGKFCRLLVSVQVGGWVSTRVGNGNPEIVVENK